MKKTLRILFVLSALLSISAIIVSTAFAQNAGAIWTTHSACGGITQDENHYETGETVYINGSGFAAGTYGWTIVGQPGGASTDPGIQVAGGSITVDASGEFCFAAYTIPAGDSGEYKVNFDTSKGDNYRVTELTQPTVTATATPTLANTPTETQIPTSTPISTEMSTIAPTLTATTAPVLTATTAPVLTTTTGSTPVPPKSPVTGSSANPALLRIAALVFGLISMGAYALLKKRIDQN